MYLKHKKGDIYFGYYKNNWIHKSLYLEITESLRYDPVERIWVLPQHTPLYTIRIECNSTSTALQSDTLNMKILVPVVSSTFNAEYKCELVQVWTTYNNKSVATNSWTSPLKGCNYNHAQLYSAN